ncbi:ATP-grasp domain-containing protein [Haloechinothrix sp. YIM 98757]|uniref:ATP-grasp domain-containing protein n=1 Tax=Haloechinothrix aidingensis TaxID=2752311 RepID=A0A838A4T4_9PSEU|nr:ATP-grasp domain-containing protein [Haloechinothrix aidingensis]MBA0123938.1 ATP-grasp domain-containing protein [Haloechinothrix aidingensis]
MSELDSFETLISAALSRLPALDAGTYRFKRSGKGRRSLDAALLADAARERGLPVLALTEELQVIGNSTAALGFFQNMCQTLTSLDRKVSNDKELTKRLLRSAGLPVARGEVVSSRDGAIEAMRRIGQPVVIKPLTGSGGKGITVGVREEDEVSIAMRSAPVRTRRFLVEESIPSIDLRIMVVAGRTVAAMLRVPAHVTGDGQSSIGELVDRKNELRHANPYLRRSPVVIDEAATRRLAALGLTPDSVPEHGRRVLLHYKANLSAGGDSVAVTDQVHPGITDLAERAAACFPSAHHSGVDILAQRFDAPPEEQNCIICEVNCNNDMPMHEFPLFGTPVPTGELEIDGYFGAGRTHLPLGRTGPAGDNRTPPDSRVLRGWRKLRRAAPARMPNAGRLATELATNRLPTEGTCDAESPRALDRRYLADALSVHGADGVRFHTTLVHAELEGRDVVLERSGRSVYTARLSRQRDALERLLEHAAVPFCRRTTVNAGAASAARDFVEKHAGPWNIYAAEPGCSLRGAFRLGRASSVERARRRLTDTATDLVIEQASESHAWRLLVVNGRVRSCLALYPATVTGDGVMTVSELVEQAAAVRRAHPYLRHRPLPEDVPGDACLARHGLDGDSVVPHGERLTLNHGTLIRAGADTVGYTGQVESELERRAREVVSLIGDPPLSTVTFARRTLHGDRAWAVTDIDTDPILVQFTQPAAGDVPTVFDEVAEMLLTGPRRVLDSRPADGDTGQDSRTGHARESHGSPIA